MVGTFNSWYTDYVTSQLDDIIILRKILEYDKSNKFKYISPTLLPPTLMELNSGLGDYTIKDVLLHLESLLEVIETYSCK